MLEVSLAKIASGKVKKISLRIGRFSLENVIWIRMQGTGLLTCGGPLSERSSHLRSDRFGPVLAAYSCGAVADLHRRPVHSSRADFERSSCRSNFKKYTTPISPSHRATKGSGVSKTETI